MQEAVAYGKITLLNGDKLILSPEMWMDVAKWLYNRIDGPPKQEIDHSGDMSFTFDPIATIAVKLKDETKEDEVE